MRKAELDKAWRSCRGPRLTNLDVREIVTQVGSETRLTRITSRVIAAVGTNGAGKTTWLQQIGSLADNKVIKPRKPIEVVRIGGMYRGNLLSLPIRNAPWAQASSPQAEYFDVGSAVHIFLKYSSSLANFEELLPQVDAHVPSTVEMEYYCFVLQKPFSRIEVYELEHPTDPDRTFPHFVVQLDGVKYDNFTMGFGELCALYLVWRCIQLQKGSILLIDEPDAHLSPRCRIAVINFFAVIASKKDSHIIFSSHSAETVATLQPDEILLFAESGAPSITASPMKHVALRKLGILTTPRVLLISEDVDAHELLLQIWARWGGELQGAVDLRIMQGGAVELERLQRLFPSDARTCKLQVVLDGDKRTEFKAPNKVLFLPGAEDPVELARRLVNVDPNYFADQLGVPVGILKDALLAIRFEDHHNFCSSLSERLDVQLLDTKRVRTCLFKTWLAEPENAASAKTLADQITALVNSVI